MHHDVLARGHGHGVRPLVATRGYAGGRFRGFATITFRWACSTAVSAGDSSINGAFAWKRAKWTGWIQGNLRAPRAHGNPEPSRRYTGGRCRDYLRASRPAEQSDYLSALNNRLEHPAPSRTLQCTGEEIVHSRWKHRGRVNPLVVGSNPTGPISNALLFIIGPGSIGRRFPGRAAPKHQSDRRARRGDSDPLAESVQRARFTGTRRAAPMRGSDPAMRNSKV